VPAYGGVAGDVYILIHVEPHPHLRREGDTVRSTEIFSFAEAALGAKRAVTTISGTADITVPAGTQPGTEVKLGGEGFPSLRGGRRGDHIVTVTIEVPRRLSKQQRQLLEEFQGLKKKKGLLF
jgi:molecular chaperone DnaJ